MVRRFSDTIHVRSGVQDGAEGVPVQFLWRGRLYVVRDVLSHWRERSAWWEHSAVAAVHGDADAPASTAPASGGVGTAVRRVLEVGVLERVVWRVEASAGRAGVVGVYDLAHPARPGTAAVSEVPATPVPEDEWQLLRVSD
ncbi:DUF6504 family protein [Kineococcus rubinsiae]|uniref:DUF6504 family protein n=1 Tax=Kineococcus rubinsiae TaxID=2609562 RepID=UPI001AD93E6E|nr:DUF6504 family protein [Kineococcus rubinsiae]